MIKRELYRDTENGKISGVCAGLANYLSLEVWLVRISVISALLLGGTFLILLIYVALSFMIEKQPPNYVETIRSEQEHTLKNKPWQKGSSPELLLDRLEQDFDNIEEKIQSIEAYVTSDAYQVNKEFKTL